MSRSDTTSGHWYTLNGDPLHEVEKKGGGLRATTLRDAKKLALVPSSTTVIKYPWDEKSALTNWVANSKVEAVLTSPRVSIDLKPGETLTEFVDDVLKVKREQEEVVDAAMQFGTGLHAAQAAALQGQAFDDHYARWIEVLKPVVADLGEIVAIERPLASKLYGFGGTVDLVLKAGDRHVIVDYKTTSKLPSREGTVWDDHAMQVASYAQLVGENLRLPGDSIDAYVLYLQNDTALNREWWNETPKFALNLVGDLTGNWKSFLCLLRYWQQRKDHRLGSVQ